MMWSQRPPCCRGYCCLQLVQIRCFLQVVCITTQKITTKTFQSKHIHKTLHLYFLMCRLSRVIKLNGTHKFSLSSELSLHRIKVKYMYICTVHMLCLYTYKEKLKKKQIFINKKWSKNKVIQILPPDLLLSTAAKTLLSGLWKKMKLHVCLLRNMHNLHMISYRVAYFPLAMLEVFLLLHMTTQLNFCRHRKSTWTKYYFGAWSTNTVISRQIISEAVFLHAESWSHLSCHIHFHARIFFQVVNFSMRIICKTPWQRLIKRFHKFSS